MKKSSPILWNNALLAAAIVLLWPTQWLLQDYGLIDSYAVRIVMLIGIRITAAVSLQLINGISGQFSLGHAGFMAIGAYVASYASTQHSEQLSRPLSVLGFFLTLALAVGAAAGVIVALYKAIMPSRRLFPAAPVLLWLGVLLWALADFALAPGKPSPWYVWTRGLATFTSVYGATVGWLVPLGQHVELPAAVAIPVSYIILLIGGGIFAACAGLVVGVPALRLRGDYLAIATLGFAEIIRVLLETSDTLGGALGMTGIPKVPGLAWVYGIAILTIVVVWRLVHSARGRAMLAVREDEIASASVGINPARSKVVVFVVGAFLAGVAGVALAHFEGYISPANFGFMQSVELVVIVTLAGSGSISGTILVAAILTWLPEQLRGFADYRMILYSLVLIILMLLRPAGLLGSRELWPQRRRAFNAAA